MLSVEDVTSQMAGSSTDTLQGYMDAVQKKMTGYAIAYNHLKGSLDEHEKHRKTAATKARAKVKSEAKKAEESLKRQGNLVVRVLLPDGRRAPVTVNKTLGVGSIRRAVIKYVGGNKPFVLSKAKGREKKTLEDIALVNRRGENVVSNPCTRIYNIQSLLDDPNLTAMWVVDLVAGAHENVTTEGGINVNEQEVEIVADDAEEDEEEDKEEEEQ